MVPSARGGACPDYGETSPDGSMRHSELVFVKRVKGKGRGVFARRAVPRGAVIERVPVLLVPIAEARASPTVADYCFLKDERTVAVALGYGSLYNHSYRPNARYDYGAGATLVF